MHKTSAWIIGLVLFLLIGSILLLGSGFLWTRGFPLYRMTSQRFAPDSNWFHHGMGIRWGLPVMGIIGGLLMLALPLGLIVLIVLGTILLVRSLQRKDYLSHEPPSTHCSHCGRRVEPHWKVCPYCGEKLSEE